MKAFNKLSVLTRFLILGIAINVIIFTAFRFLFLKIFYNPNDPLQWSQLAESLYIGLKFDIRLSILINLPVFIFAWIKYIGMFKSGFGKWLWLVYLTLINLAVIFLYISDLGHYAYLETRLDATILSYLYNPDISIGVVWETYPVVWYGLGVTGFVLIYAFSVRWLILRLANDRTMHPSRWMKGITAALMIPLLSAGIYGKLSYYPLRWSDAYYSSHPFAAALALNPVLYFFDTFGNREKAYDEAEVRKNYDTLVNYLGVADPDQDKLNFLREIDPPERLTKKPNIVMVFLESFAIYKTGIGGNPLNPSPHFDSLTNDAMFFRRFYVPSTGTARSVFAALTGIPDIETIGTSTFNPIVVSHHTIINSFEDYEKFYFIGGSANWRNVRGLLAYNIPGLHIYEEGSYSSPRTDVWGISDLHLFEEANRVLNKQDKPFFAIIHTAGNHRPYTIPDDNRGFTLSSIGDGEAKKHGFTSTQEFNSFRFMDHSIGFFINTAKKEGYFDNTFFVFFGDHGLPGSAPHIQKSEEQLDLTRNHVPLVIYAPGIIKKGTTIDKIASELDVLPTIASLTSTPYVNTTIGRDLLDPHYDNQRYAFTTDKKSTNPHIGLVSDELYFMMLIDGSDKSLHSLSSDKPRENIINKFPDKALEMEQICRSIFEAARYMRYHNSQDRLKSASHASVSHN